MMRFKSITTIVLGGCLGFLSGVHAQTKGVGSVGGSYAQDRYARPANEAGGDDILGGDRRGFHPGSWEIHPRVGFYAIQEDNLFLSSETPTEETYMVLSPGIGARYGKNEKRYLTMDVATDISISNEEDPEDMNNVQVSLGGYAHEGKSSMYGRYTYRYLRSGDIIVGNRISKKEHSASAGYDRKISRKTSWGVHGNYLSPDYEEESYTDYEDGNVGLRFSWQAFDKTTLYTQGTYGRVKVDTIEDEFADAEYVEGSIGMASTLSQRWSLNGRVGYQERMYENEDLQNVEGYTGNMVLSGHVFDYWNVSLGAWSLIQPAVNEAGATMVEKRIQPAISRRIFVDQVVGSASMVWGQVDYSTSNAAEEAGEISNVLVYDGRQDDYWGYTLAVDWAVSDGLSTGLEYSYIENKWNGPEDIETTNYEAGRWIFRVEYVY